MSRHCSCIPGAEPSASRTIQVWKEKVLEGPTCRDENSGSQGSHRYGISHSLGLRFSHCEMMMTVSSPGWLPGVKEPMCASTQHKAAHWALALFPNEDVSHGAGWGAGEGAGRILFRGLIYREG